MPAIIISFIVPFQALKYPLCPFTLTTLGYKLTHLLAHVNEYFAHLVSLV